jgi:hypothetical protein
MFFFFLKFCYYFSFIIRYTFIYIVRRKKKTKKKLKKLLFSRKQGCKEFAEIEYFKTIILHIINENCGNSKCTFKLTQLNAQTPKTPKFRGSF